MTEAKNDFHRRKKNIEEAWEVYEKLKAMGFRITPPDSIYRYTFKCPRREQLPSIRKALGALRMCDRQVIDNDDKNILVVLIPESYPSVRITYKTRLDPRAKCKIVTQPVTYTSRSLICSRH